MERTEIAMKPSIRRTQRFVLGLLALAILCPGALWAQGGGGDNNPPPQPVQRDLPPLSGFSVIPFKFGPPGARSLGMGGTFIALADDATAAEANPAGLTKLSRPEVSLHGRSTSFDIETLDINAVTALDALNRGRAFPDRIRPGQTVGNAFATGTRARFDPEVTEVSFASYVHPSPGYTFSVFYQQSADFSGVDRFEAFDDSILDYYRTNQRLDLTFANLGVSAAFDAGEHLSVGFSVRFGELDVNALQDSVIEYGADIELGALPAGSSLDQVRATGILDQRILRETFDDRETDITFNVGLLFNPRGRFSVGLVYKDGGNFSIGGMDEDFGCLDAMAAPGEQCRPDDNNDRMRIEREFKVPDLLGVGLAWMITERFKVALDANYITYSDFGVGPAADPNAGPEVAEEFEPIDDELEWHFGAELISFIGGTPLTLRAGVYTASDTDGFTSIDSEETIFTFGLGTVIRDNFQIDIAGQASDRAEVAILSLVYRF